jgi:hypothetical protein
MSRECFPAAVHRLFVPVWALVLIAVCLEATAADSTRAPTVRLRIEWSAEAPAVWTGRLTIHGGRFEQPQSLGLARDDAGTISIEGGLLMLRRRSARVIDALEVSARAAPESRLEIELRDRDGTQASPAIHLTLADCLHKPRVFAAEGNRPRMVVRRSPGDALPVRFDRPHLVFDPDETFRASVALNLLDPRERSDKPVRSALRWKLLPAGGSRPISEGSTTVAALVNPTTPVDVPLELRLPREEGVYNLRLAASGLGFTDVEREVQVVVVGPARGGASRAGAVEKLVDAFEPSPANLFRKVSLTSLRAKPDRERSRSHKIRHSRNEPAGESGGLADSTTVAYKLRVSHPGHPHRLELALPPGSDQSLSVALWQADDEGQLVPFGPEEVHSAAGAQPGRGRAPGGSAAGSSVFTQFFWPQEREVVLSITARRPGQAIDVARIRLYDLGEELPASGPDPAAAEAVPRHRLVGRYLHRPVLAWNFGAPQSIDDAERTRLDDWRTFLVAGRRLTEWLRHQQQSALLLGVYADGAAIYPSERLEPSLLFDSGRLASNGQDPAPKDVLELLLRLFDREGLALVPELQFNAPLPDLERLLREPAEMTEDLLLVDGEGRTLGDSPGAARGAHPGYNVLSPRVQQAVLEAVAELVERCQSHPSLAGLAFELSPDSVLQLPGIEWGYDRQTIRRFEQSTRLHVPGGEGPAWRRESCRYLTTTARREWLRFRCAEVAGFHRRLAELVTGANPDLRVVFSGHLDPLGDSDSEAAVLGAVRAGRSPAQLLLAEGLDFSQGAYAAERNVTVLRPLLENDAADGLARAALATFNTSPAIDGLYRSASRGGLIYTVGGGHLQSWTNAGTGGGEVASASAPRPGSNVSAGRRRYVHLLAALDPRMIFDGGPTIPLTSDDETLSLRQTIALLPDVPFPLAGPQVQPVAVRATSAGEDTFVYAVNESPLPLTVEMLLDCPAGTPCRALEGGRRLPLEPATGSGKSRLRVELEGRAVFACRLDRIRAAVLETRLLLAEGLLADVQQRIDSLSVRMNTVTSLARAGSRSLPNPGFEQPGTGDAELPGWELPVQTAGWTLDDENPRSGQKSLLLSAEGKRPLLESPALALEGSRFVTMSLWMRSSRSAARVQMGFDAKIGGEAYAQEAIVEVGKGWKQYFFRVDQLPAGQMHHARLRVRPVDACKLWIDDVDIDAQSFSADEVRQLTKTLSSVKLAWEEGRYADCQRLLDGYWGQLLLSEPVAPPALAPARTRQGERAKNAFRR